MCYHRTRSVCHGRVVAFRPETKTIHTTHIVSYKIFYEWACNAAAAEHNNNDDVYIIRNQQQT